MKSGDDDDDDYDNKNNERDDYDDDDDKDENDNNKISELVYCISSQQFLAKKCLLNSVETLNMLYESCCRKTLLQWCLNFNILRPKNR